MTSYNMKSIGMTLMLILLRVLGSLQNPIASNYTSQLLRQAKLAEFMAYRSENDMVCSNFYEQACGNWEKSFPATFDETKTSHLGQIHNLYVSKARDALQNYQGSEVSHLFVSKFYASCSNKTQIEHIGIKPILDHFNFKGGWPAIKNMVWYEREFDWLKTVADIRRDLGLNLFIGLELKHIPNYYVSLKRIHIGPPKLPLVTRSKYLDATFENERVQYKQKIFEKLRRHFRNTTDLWCREVADQVLNVEISLAKGLTVSKNQTAAQQQNEQTITQLKTKYAAFVDFGRYLTLIFDNPNEPIHEIPGDYFTNLLKVIETTPKLTVANYTMWRVLDHFEFAADKKGAAYEIWCTQQVIKYFPEHVASLYATVFKTRETDKTGMLIRKIFSDVERALEAKFNEADKFKWMSTETRQKVNEHSGRIIFSVLDTAVLESYLDNILYAIKKDQYFENLLHILQLETKRRLQLNFHDPATQLEAYSSSKVPFYSAKHKEIIVPTEFLETHFLFDPEYPHAINYGTVGVLLAQQLLRGLLNNDAGNKWWDNATETQFAERKNCFVKQLGNYEFHGKPVNDKDGVFKFIIFTSAIEIAFDAYAARLKQEKIDPATETLSNQFGYGNERLFFLSFAEMYCADYYLLSFKKFTELPERLLIKGALTNFAKFGEIFKCASYTQMNRGNKCTIF